MDGLGKEGRREKEGVRVTESMKRVIVTGANGFVGKWLLKELDREGVQVTAVVRSQDADLSEIRCLAHAQILFCDMAQLSRLPQMINGQYDTFYHLAWNGSTGDLRGDYGMQLENARWTCQAVEAAHAVGCTRFIGAGTLAELDVQAYVAQDGAKPAQTMNYGTAKIAAHYMSKAVCQAVGMQHVWAYLPNLYGEGNQTSNFVNFAAKTMLSGKEANFTSGEQLYDFVYISDAARALCLLGEKGRDGYSYYIGSNAAKKLKYFIMQIKDAVHPQIRLHLGAVPFYGVAQEPQVFDCKKLMEHTGYLPQVSFEEGIQRTVAWLRLQMEEQGSNHAEI